MIYYYLAHTVVTFLVIVIMAREISDLKEDVNNQKELLYKTVTEQVRIINEVKKIRDRQAERVHKVDIADVSKE